MPKNIKDNPNAAELLNALKKVLKCVEPDINLHPIVLSRRKASRQMDDAADEREIDIQYARDIAKEYE